MRQLEDDALEDFAFADGGGVARLSFLNRLKTALNGQLDQAGKAGIAHTTPFRCVIELHWQADGNARLRNADCNEDEFAQLIGVIRTAELPDPRRLGLGQSGVRVTADGENGFRIGG